LTTGVLFPTGAGKDIFVFATGSRQAQGPIWPSIQWVPGSFPVRLKRPGRNVDLSCPSNCKANDVWSHNSTPAIHLHGVVLSYEQGKFTLTYLVYYGKLVNICLSWPVFC